MADADKLGLIKDTAQEFLSQIGFGSEVVISVNYAPDQDLYQVSLQTSSPGLIIGYHGDALSALQTLLGHHLKAKTGEWFNLSVNVNDYRERRQTALNSLADSVVSKVVSTGLAHSLPPMPANERRLVHMHLADHPQVVTASEGLGKNRSVVISPKSA